MLQLNSYLSTLRYGIRDMSYEKHRVWTTGFEMLSTQLGRSVLLRGWNLTQCFLRAHKAHSLETWGSSLRTMKIWHGGCHVGFIDVCCPALKQLLCNSFTLPGCKTWPKGPWTPWKQSFNTYIECHWVCHPQNQQNGLWEPAQSSC